MTIRVVFDTNVVLSALIGHGAAKKSVSLARTKIIQACYCGSMLSELSEKLQKRLHYTVDDLRAEYILSEDHHLLDLESYEGIKIVRPRDFLMKLRELAIIE